MDRQRQSYLSNVSHELRTPLTVIQGYLEALRHAGPPRRRRPARAGGAPGTVPAPGPHDRRGAGGVAPGAGRGPAAPRLGARARSHDLARKVVQALRTEAALKSLRLVERLPEDSCRRWSATSVCCTSCCSTWSRTRSSSRAEGGRGGRGDRAPGRRRDASACATPASASRPSTTTGLREVLHGGRRLGPPATAAPASACTWPGRWWPSTTATSAWRARRPRRVLRGAPPPAHPPLTAPFPYVPRAHARARARARP